MYHRQNKKDIIMKKNYMAPVMEVEVIGSLLTPLLTSPLTNIDMGDPAGDGEDITADSKLFDEFDEEEEW